MKAFIGRKSIILQLCHLVPASAVDIAVFYPHQKFPPFLGHINRLKFMSSPSLSELGKREQAALDERGTQQGQAGSNATWNSIHNGVIAVFKNTAMPEHQLYSLNEGVRHLLKTELGSFFTEYLQNQLLTKGMVILRDKIRFYDGQTLLDKLAETWDFFFTYVLPMLQAIFYPVQGKDPSIRQLALLHFRNIIALHSKLEENLMKPTARIPPSLIQMLLILQGVHESKGVTEDHIKLEKLVQVVVSPYLGTYGLYANDEPVSHSTCILEERTFRRCLKSGEVVTKNPVVRSKSYNYSLLTPVAEYEAENVANQGTGIRRHSVSEMTSFDLEEYSTLSTITDSGSKISVNTPKVQPTGEQDHTTVVSAHSTSVQHQGMFHAPGTRDDQRNVYKLSSDSVLIPAPSSSPETIVDQILESIDSDSEGIFIDFGRNCASSSGYNTDVNRQSIV